MPKFDEVKARVSDEVLKRKAIDVARERAAAVAAQMKSGDFNAAAKAAGLEVKRPPLARGAAIADVGGVPRDAAAFALRRRCQRSGRDRHGGVIGKCSKETRPRSARVEHAPRPGVTRTPRDERYRPHGAAERTAQSLLRVLHDEGTRADEGEHQSRRDRAAGGVKPSAVLGFTGFPVLPGANQLRLATLEGWQLRAGSYRMNTFGISASGSPRRKTRKGVVRSSSARGSRNPSMAPSVPGPAELPNGFLTIS